MVIALIVPIKSGATVNVIKLTRHAAVSLFALEASSIEHLFIGIEIY